MKPLLEVDSLELQFRRRSGPPRTVLAGVKIALYPGEVLGLVGESGSGKSITASAILGLLPAEAEIRRGSIRFRERELLTLNKTSMREIRGREIALIPQAALSVLNPCLRVDLQIREPLEIHLHLSRANAQERAAELLEEAGLKEPERVLRLYPHELSGGMRQRVTIAIALACNPVLLLADEPTTALDAVIRHEVLERLVARTHARNASLLLITHDLPHARLACERIAVLYAGWIVEQARTEALFSTPRHPYTYGLLRSNLPLDYDGELLQEIPGRPPGPDDHYTGCPFAPRCFRARERCREEMPGETFEADRSFRCFYPIE